MSILRFALCIWCSAFGLISASVLSAQQPDVSSLFESLGGIEQFKRKMIWPPTPKFPSAEYFSYKHRAFQGSPTALTKVQKEKLDELTKHWNQATFSLDNELKIKVNSNPKKLTEEEIAKVQAFAEKILTEHEAELAKIVTAEQIARAKELYILSLEATAFLKDPVARALNLDNKQLTQIEKILNSNPFPAPPFPLGSTFGAGKPPKATKTQIKAREAQEQKWRKDHEATSQRRLTLALKVLTPDQKDVYQQLTGQKFPP